MQLGFLRLNSPPDCLTYFPSFRVGKKCFELCGARPRAPPLDSAAFEKAGETFSIASLSFTKASKTLPIQDLHKLFAGDGLFLVQELCKLVELLSVLLQNPHRLRVLLLHKVNHLSVDLRLRFGAARQ